jgi:UDP-glucose 4-epimerase
VRLFSLYGPGLRKQILWDACEKATADSFNFSGQGEERRDFLHVTDAAKLLVLAAHNASEKCHRVNGGTGIGSTIKEILEVIGSCWAPPKKPLFSNTTRLGDPAHYIADTELLKAWGYKPQKNLFEEISNYVEWYKQAK